MGRKERYSCVFPSSSLGNLGLKMMVTAISIQILVGRLEISKSPIFQWCIVDTIHTLSKVCQISG